MSLCANIVAVKMRWKQTGILRLPECGLHVPQSRPLLAFSGGGIFFFWQLGAVEALREVFDLRCFELCGASAGAFAALFAATGVTPETALETSNRLAAEMQVHRQTCGLVGIWGKMLRVWLDRLLPQNAVSLCDGRLTVVAVSVRPLLAVHYLNDMQTRDELLDATLASAHLPFLLDGSFSAQYKDLLLFDGLKLCEKSIFLRPDVRRPVIVINPVDDPWVAQNKTFIDIRTRSHQEVTEMFHRGKQWVSEQLKSQEILSAFSECAALR